MKLHILTTFLITLSIAHGAQDAIIKNYNSVAYADIELSSPLGYIRQKRKIKIGSKLLKKGTIARLLVSGKIAYIQTKDLYLLKNFTKKDLSEIKFSKKRGSSK